MLAQSKSTGVISENIANMTTTGYKRSSSSFHEMISQTSKTTLSSAVDRSSGVGQHIVNHITDQGSIQQTTSGTDAAIVGNGFFTVGRSTNPSDGLLYTRNGTFQEDANGILRNSAGFLLYGVPTDGSGNVIGDISNPSSFEAIDVNAFETASASTTMIAMALNLDAEEELIDPHALVPAQELPVTSQAAQFSRSVTVYDGNGTERVLNFEFRRTIGPMAHLRSNAIADNFQLTDVLVDDASGPTPGITNGMTFNISNGTTFSATFVNGTADTSLNQVNTVADLITVVNNFIDPATSQPAFLARLEGGDLLIQAKNPTDTLDISANNATILGVNGFNFVTDPADADYVYAPEASMTANGTANPDQLSFPAFADTATPNPYNWWEMSVHTIDPANPNGTATVEVRKGLINFDGSGAINMTPDANGALMLDLSGLNFDNSVTGDEIDVSFNMTRFTQFSGDHTVVSVTQDGAPSGARSNISIDTDGTVRAVFENGLTLPIYKIPIATFNNADGLDRIAGTAFQQSETSGTVSYAEAGTNGAGTVLAASLENSNVDLSKEFGHLITSQRAYSMSSQIITAANEMAQTLTRLK